MLTPPQPAVGAQANDAIARIERLIAQAAHDALRADKGRGVVVEIVSWKHCA